MPSSSEGLRRRWLTGDVWFIASSAFFADLGYQAVLAVFPLFLVLSLHASVALLGVAMALAYGPGALAGYVGGRLGDARGRRRVALWGNSLIPLLSLSGLVTSAWAAAGLLSVGWWARTFRSPPRRAMLTEAVSPEHRARAFGFLHALDVGGGALAALAAFVLVSAHVPYRAILLLTIMPLVLSTLALARVRVGRPGAKAAPAAAPTPESGAAPLPSIYRGVLLASALYGFASYSAAFPILTLAQGTRHPALGVLGYLLLLLVSALTGLAMGRSRLKPLTALPVLGYLVAAVGSVGLAVGSQLYVGTGVLLPSMAVLGFALGVVETMEPTLIDKHTRTQHTSRGMGSLTAARSVGLLVANLLLGLLYTLTPAASYGYAAAMAVAAALVLLLAGRRATRT